MRGNVHALSGWHGARIATTWFRRAEGPNVFHGRRAEMIRSGDAVCMSAWLHVGGSNTRGRVGSGLGHLERHPLPSALPTADDLRQGPTDGQRLTPAGRRIRATETRTGRRATIA